MSKETIIDNEYATLWYHPDRKVVHHQIKKFIFGEHFKEILMKGAEIFEDNHCTKWLSNDKSSSVLKPEDLEWGDLNWKPRIIKAGWKYWALVMPEKVIGQLNMKHLVESYSEAGVTVKIFSSEEEGLKWLDAQ